MISSFELSTGEAKQRQNISGLIVNQQGDHKLSRRAYVAFITSWREISPATVKLQRLSLFSYPVK